MTVEVKEQVVQEPVTPVVEPEATPEVVVPAAAPEATPEVEEVAAVETPKTTEDKLEGLLVAAGVDLTAVATAMKENEGKLTPELMQALVAKHGESVASLLGMQLETLHTEQTAKVAEANKVVYDFVKEQFEGATEQSGEETWKELATWTKDNVDKGMQQELNAMLAQGGLAAKLAIKELADTFKEAQGTGDQEAQLEEGDSFGTSTRGAITKDEYAAELRVLMDEKGLGYESREVTALQARRQKGIARGM